ncbi:hypothetical protein E2562_003548 [Oryza meyeriana var. granulata]|uniref:Helitron helicase-like domain-containing protein n=1 Tax=Oryza meyeriana var. granulata TaxID=110450 RepID=A0A6G1CLN6_9ORYZ|nr:hypothetical protein E2562_003548 [Oryza meyeriana var. granulata]
MWASSLLPFLYTVEFQKRGLPHIHCLVWPAASNAEMAHRLISELYHGDDNTRIWTLVSRLWHFCDKEDESNILHIDLVLIDEMALQFVETHPVSGTRLLC